MFQHWIHLTKNQLEATVAEAKGSVVAVTVLGATEQHGPHLPLGTDTLIGEALLECALSHLKPGISVLVMPTLTMGVSEEHADFSGTISLSAQTLTEQLLAQGQALAQVGVTSWVWLNTHGGNTGVMDTVAVTVRARHRLIVAKAYYPKFDPLPDGPTAQECREGLHGGQVETSMMLAIAPEMVDVEKAADFKLTSVPKAGQASVAWLAQDLNPEGVAGQASLASPQEGAALIEHYGQALAEVIDATAAYPTLGV